MFFILKMHTWDFGSSKRIIQILCNIVPYMNSLRVALASNISKEFLHCWSFKHIWKCKCGFWRVIDMLLTFSVSTGADTKSSCHVTFFVFYTFSIVSLGIISVVVFITPNVVVYDNPWSLFTLVGHWIDVDSEPLTSECRPPVSGWRSVHWWGVSLETLR